MPESLTDRAARIATSTLANTLDDFDLGGKILPSIKSVAPGFRFAGPAVTLKEVVGDVGSHTLADFCIGAIIDATSAGDVIVIDADGACVSTWGGMASYAAKLKGIAGLLVDGAVRDLNEMVAFDFSVFSRHLTPLTGRTRLKVEAIGVPVSIDGVAVAPGDLIVADNTGVVVLPQAQATQINARAETFAADDTAALQDLKAGMMFSEAMAKYTRI